MERKTFVTGCAATAAVGASFAPASAAESAYDLTTATGSIFGALLLPDSGSAFPVALIVAGSGPTDRDGNSPLLKLDTYKKLATALAARGIASVRYDKRGIGASGAAAGPEATLRFEAYIDDAAAWLSKMRADKRFKSVSLVGHSEGSLIGMVAVQRSRVEGYISLEGAGFPADEVLRTQLRAQLASDPALMEQSEHILEELKKGNQVADVPPVLGALFRTSVQPYLISWFKYDPRVEIAKISAPVTIVQGTHDLQVSVEDGKALVAASPNATFVLIDGMTHVLSDDPSTSLKAQLQGAYADAARPLDPRLIEATVAAIGK